MDAADLKIVNNEALHRWEAHVGHDKVVAEYQYSGDTEDTIVFTHTEAPPALEGRGITSRLVQAALDDARARRLAVVPYCPFVAGYIRRHPAYKTLVPRNYRHLLRGDRNESE